MKIIDTTAGGKVNKGHFEAILMKENYILFYDRGEAGFNHNRMNLYKYCLETGSFSEINTSAEITEYFFSPNKEKMYYINTQVLGKNYMLHFYELNYDNEVDKEVFQFSLPRIWRLYEDEYSYEQGPDVTIHNHLMTYSLSNRYLMYLHTIEHGIEIEEREDGFYVKHDEYGRAYNEYKLYIYDIVEAKSYEVLDKSFIEEGHHDFEVINLADNNYLMLKTVIWNPWDKRDYVWGEGFSKEENFDRYTKWRDSIKLISLEKMIDEVKCGKHKLSYKEIDFLEANGSIDFSKVIDSKIYYELITFDNNKKKLACYDILSGEYTYENDLVEYEEITSFGDDIYYVSFEEETIKLVNSISKEKISFNEDERCLINGNIFNMKGLLGKKFAFIEDLERCNDDIHRVYYMKDIESGAVVKKYMGYLKVFHSNEIVVVYQYDSF
jgi:hypothetical protein